ncbi:hypothetical protein C2845_PM02G15650 [Panicum miliaceum]|uniref:Uncharacterized protein n=1 Tax=Panicum miliaceum TaxID=4540 RepID=A0A3L6SAA3_PANMI|nr:hypothetical protein C2845_PM02G15650 [Panicum miliaceum]
MTSLCSVRSQGRSSEIAPLLWASRGTVTPMGEVVGMYDKLTPVCILIRRTCSWGPPIRRVWLASALPVGDSDTCKAEPRRGPKSEPLSPDHLLGRGRKPCFCRPAGRSGSWDLAAWTKSRPTKMGVHSRWCLGPVGMPAGGGSVGNPGP